jgi:uncharacterized protein
MGYWSSIIRLHLSALGALVVVVGAMSCERGDTAGVVRGDTAAAKQGQAQGGGVGSDCEQPQDCKGYLLCMDGNCQVPPGVEGEHDAQTPRARFVDAEDEEVATFFVELAITDAEQTKGLMFRRQMQPDWGMLFIYPDQDERSFWMENTFIALDMIFIDAAGRIVHIIEEAEPLTRVQRRSREPARYVLELIGGRAAQVGLQRGHRMHLEGVDEAYLPTR